VTTTDLGTQTITISIPRWLVYKLGLASQLLDVEVLDRNERAI
jgi:hypothetical protein